MIARFLYSLVVILLFRDVDTAVVVTVPICYQTGVQWVVTGGSVGGATHVEKTTNSDCQFNITSSSTETFFTNYTLCGATPDIRLSGIEHKMTIVVQDNLLYNGKTDTRWLVTCQFNTQSQPVESIVDVKSNNPSGGPNNTVIKTINPRPKFALYVDSSGSETLVVPTTVLTIGTNVTARITLDTNTTDYTLQVTRGDVAAMNDMNTILASVSLLNDTTYCALYPVFLSFDYIQTADGFWYAETTFQVFLPTVTSVNLQTDTINLRISFIVSLCLLAGSGCSQVACPDRSSSRRRRQAEDQSKTDSENEENFQLYGGFRIALDDSTTGKTKAKGDVFRHGTIEAGRNVCLEKSNFFGLVVGFLSVLTLTGFVSCFLILSCRKRRRSSETSSETGTISLTTTERKLSGNQLKQSVSSYHISHISAKEEINSHLKL